MLDAGHPIVENPAAGWAESKRLGQLAHQARKVMAVRVATGADPGCPGGAPSGDPAGCHGPAWP